MIAQLNGTLLSKTSTEAIIDCGGVGYLAYISLATYETIPEPGEKVRLFTLLVPREDAVNLYGFASETEREAFKLLTSISGIGAKTSLGILSSVSLPELQEYIISGNIISLSKLPGIGKKTAERIIIELRDKILKIGVVELTPDNQHLLIKEEALSALTTLGYSRITAEKAIRSVLKDSDGRELTAEELIKKSLRFAML